MSIGVRMLDDAYRDVCDRLVVVSGDSDLVPAVRMVKTRFPQKEIVVYIPATNPVRGAAVELRAAADKHRLLPLQILPRSQSAARVPDGAGGLLVKPTSWQRERIRGHARPPVCYRAATTPSRTTPQNRS